MVDFAAGALEVNDNRSGRMYCASKSISNLNATNLSWVVLSELEVKIQSFAMRFD